MTYNPSLREIPRNQTADVLPTQKEPSILAWLEGTGRLKPREVVAAVGIDEEEESEEIDDLMGDSDRSFDDDDDDLTLDDED